MSVFIKKLIVTGIMAAVLASCGLVPPKRYIVESTHIITNTKIIKPDIITTPAYNNMKNDVKTIAIRAPEICSVDSFKSSESVKTNSIISSDCGRAMAVLERELVRNGYRVVSWKVIASKSENKSALTIAKTHKADILLQINALNEAVVIIEEIGNWQDEYFQSNNNGEKGNKTTINTEHAAFIKGNILDEDRRNKMLAMLGKQRGVTIDVTATAVKTAESVWFYKWTKLDEHSRRNQFSITSYVMCKEISSNCREFEPYKKPSKKISKQEVNNAQVAGTTSITDSSQYTDINGKIYTKLAEEVINDMVKHLKK